MSSRLLPGLVLGLGGLFTLRRIDDADTWWHLAAGRWIAENTTVPLTDTLSHTAATHPWINLRFVYDLLLYGLYRLGGADALISAAIVCYGITLAAVALRVGRRLGPGPTSLILLWVLLVAQDRFAVRPEMLSFVFLQIVLALLDRARRDDGRRLWLLVPLMAVWVNCHALYVVGLFAIGCSVAAVLAVEHLPLPAAWRAGTVYSALGRRRLFVSAALATVATAANPHFVRGAIFPLRLPSRFNEFGSIGEYQGAFTSLFPDVTRGAFQSLFVLAIVAVAAAAIASARRRESPADPQDGFDLTGLLVFAGLAYLSLLAYRNMALFALGVAPFLAQCLALIGARTAPGPTGTLKLLRRATAGLVVAAITLCAWLVTTNRYYRFEGRTHEFGRGVLEVNFPIRAAEFFERHDLPGPIYNDVAAGGYLAWARPGGKRVYIDGRLEVYDEFFLRYSKSLQSPDAWTKQAKEFGIQSVVLFHGWSNRHGLIGWLDGNSDWALVYFDEVAVVFVLARGNEGSVARSRAAFDEEYAGMLARLLAPPDAWGYPLGRVLAWLSLSQLFGTLGDAERAAECLERADALRAASG